MQNLAPFSQETTPATLNSEGTHVI